MAENIRGQNLVQATSGVFIANLRMPLLEDPSEPGQMAGDMGLYDNTVYVRAEDKSVIALAGSGPAPVTPTWSQVLTAGSNSGATTPLIAAGQQIIFLDAIRIGGGNANANSTSFNAIAIGGLSNAASLGTIAIGHSASASGLSSIAIGDSASVTQNNTLAVGRSATSTFANSSAFGYGAATTKVGQVVIGNNATGACAEVLTDVGTAGITQTTGFFRAGFNVQSAISTSGGQAIVPGSFTAITFPLSQYDADYGTPAINSVSDSMFVRVGYGIVGTVSLEFTCPPLAANEVFLARIAVYDGSTTYYLLQSIATFIGNTGFSCNIPYYLTPFNVTRRISVEVNNPSIANITTSNCVFTGCYTN